MIKAVIFDFDETLCMNEETCFHLENAALARLGRPAEDREVHKATWGLHLDEAMAKRSSGVDITEFRPILFSLQSKLVEDGKIDVTPAENLAVLDELAGRGKQIMILTGRDGDDVKHLMDPQHHLGSRVSHFYYRENNNFHKPDPRTFAIVEKEHGLKPAECVYVGDSTGDAAAAKGAGLHFVASLESGLRSRADFAGYGVDAFINKLSELPAVIDKLELT